MSGATPLYGCTQPPLVDDWFLLTADERREREAAAAAAATSSRRALPAPEHTKQPAGVAGATSSSSQQREEAAPAAAQPLPAEPYPQAPPTPATGTRTSLRSGRRRERAPLIPQVLESEEPDIVAYGGVRRPPLPRATRANGATRNRPAHPSL